MLKNNTTYLPEQAIVDIIVKELGLSTQNVWIRDQNKKIPNDDGLYVVVGFVDGGEVIAIQNDVVSTDEGMMEKQKIVLKENIQIDVKSRNNDALFRRYEVLQALSSVYSVQQQEKYNFKIFKLPTSFVNTSDAEGGSRLNRFTCVIACHTWNLKQKVLDSTQGYYDDFSTRVDDENSIGTDEGIIEFNITED